MNNQDQNNIEALKEMVSLIAERFDKIAAYTIDLHRLPDVVHDLERLGFKFSE